jgi:hypothetical protein
LVLLEIVLPAAAYGARGLDLQWRPTPHAEMIPIDLVDYNNLKELVRENPCGFESRMARDKLRRHERELEREGVTVESWAQAETRTAR